MYIVSIFCAIGVWCFWVDRTPIADGGVYVADVLASIAFQRVECPKGSDASCGSCSNMAVYAMLVYSTLPAVVLVGLPATCIRLFEPFKRQARDEELSDAAEGKLKVTRTIYMQICELLCSGILLFNMLVFLYFAYSITRGDNFACSLVRVQVYMFGAIITFSGVMIEITYFARFREHVKMQLGAFLESMQTSDGLSRTPNRFRTPRACVIIDIRKRFLEETVLGNLHEIEKILVEAKHFLGDDFVADLYRDASITFGLFGRSMKNPLHVAAFHGNIPVMKLLVNEGFRLRQIKAIAVQYW
uniref:Uncharacterized protein n=1 Tax=Globisporangium ultimum (strain ATCC 200006 / CBS 805.95 / DAOM BR144) TaxID=431595 RepID=K3WZM6_GLOUD